MEPGYEGWYDDDTRTIVINASLDEARARSVLAHELVHAERHDKATGSAWGELLQEHHVDAIAARLLLPLDVLGDALCGAVDEVEVAGVLMVTLDILRARMADLTAAETAYISARVAGTVAP